LKKARDIGLSVQISYSDVDPQFLFTFLGTSTKKKTTSHPYI